MKLFCIMNMSYAFAVAFIVPKHVISGRSLNELLFNDT